MDLCPPVAILLRQIPTYTHVRKTATTSLRPIPVESPRYYYQLLEPLVQELALWETQYMQALRGPDPVKEWVKGPWLKPLLDALDSTDQIAFEAEYARRLRGAYPPLPSGVTLFPFKRLLLIASR